MLAEGEDDKKDKTSQETAQKWARCSAKKWPAWPLFANI
jgi:hypothetical protein